MNTIVNKLKKEIKFAILASILVLYMLISSCGLASLPSVYINDYNNVITINAKQNCKIYKDGKFICKTDGIYKDYRPGNAYEIQFEDEKIKINKDEISLIALINKERKRSGLNELKVAGSLMRACDFKNKMMYDTGIYSHHNNIKDVMMSNNPYKSDFIYNSFIGYSENLTVSGNKIKQPNLKKMISADNNGNKEEVFYLNEYETPENAFNCWMNSPSHKQAMLDDNINYIGVDKLKALSISRFY